MRGPSDTPQTTKHKQATFVLTTGVRALINPRYLLSEGFMSGVKQRQRLVLLRQAVIKHHRPKYDSQKQ